MRMPIQICAALLWLIAGVGHGHVVEQMYLGLEQRDVGWVAEVTFDAAYALPELREDGSRPQPERSWLLGKSEEEHAELRAGAKAYLRESLTFLEAGEPVDYTVSFPDYEVDPPNFPRLLNEGAYFTVRMVGSWKSGRSGDLSLAVADGPRPSFVVGRKSGDTPDYVVVPPGGEGRLFSASAPVEETGWGLWSFVWLGFSHVVPYGLDHLLFILALFLMAREWRPLLHQSLAFTLAHSITLALAASGVLWLGGGGFLVEPLIALSIVLLAVENLCTERVGSRRIWTVFLFGLVHGLGFAGSLGVVLRENDNWLIVLVLANVGVELAQVSVLAVAWICTLRWWKSSRYKQFRFWASAAIGAVGLVWVVQRLII